MGELGSVKGLVEVVEQLAPDIVVSDYSIPGEDTLAAFESLKNSNYKGRLVILTGVTSLRVYQKLVDIGVDGILDKSNSSKDLLTVITAVMKSDSVVLSTSVEEQLNNHSFGLSSRELEVIELVVKGLTNQKVAEILFISPKTVDNHRTKILKKLNLML